MKIEIIIMPDTQDLQSGQNKNEIELKFGENTALGQLTLARFSKKDRLRKSIIRGLLGLGATILSVFIPIAHFILVPIGLIVTPIIAISAFQTSSLVLSGEGLCPACGAEFNITKRKAVFPFRDVCEKCVRPIVIDLKV